MSINTSMTRAECVLIGVDEIDNKNLIKWQEEYDKMDMRMCAYSDN